MENKLNLTYIQKDGLLYPNISIEDEPEDIGQPMRRLDIPHVSYTLTVRDGYPFSVCEDFMTPQTELVGAWHLMQTRKKENHVSVYQHYLNCCEALGIPNMREALDRMMVVDYLIVNEDRHLNNFGTLRNAETLQCLGAAPIYDSGTSLWFESPVRMIDPAASKQPCKPFKTSHGEQIKLATSFDWVDLPALDGIDEEFRKIVKGSPFVDEVRCNALCAALRGRVEMLAEAIREHVKYTAVPGWSSEIQANIAYCGDEVPER